MGKFLPANFNPRAPLPANGEVLLKQAFKFRYYAAVSYNLGLFFLNEALDELFRHFDDNARKAYDARRWMLIAHINTDDQRGFRSHCNYWWDWDRTYYQRRHEIVNVTKYVPGDHFHTLNERFDTLDEAIRHIRANGYTYGRFEETHIYRERQ